MSYIQNGLLNRIDKFFAENYVRLAGEQAGSLSTFLFHGLFRGPQECRSDLLDVQQGITTRHFETFIEYFLDNKYVFASQEDILKGLSPDNKYAFITFDDGYFNNTLALDVLRKFKVPATFFIVTNNVIGQKCFWWDALMRERSKQKVNLKKIIQEQNFLKQQKNLQIESYLIEQFGPKVLDPISDVDRPMTVEELKDFSRQPFVSIGNHTANHAILTNYSCTEIKEEIRQAQDDLQKITGIRPVAISYPNGNSSRDSVAAAKEVGLKIGITGVEGKNYLPFSAQDGGLLSLKRFILWGEEHFETECLRARSDMQLKSSLRKMKNSFKNHA